MNIWTSECMTPLSRRLRQTLAVCLLLAAGPAAATDTWLLSTHPCPGGNRTDALWRDADGTLWVGCGTNATGYGLFLSEDGGSQWRAAVTEPREALDGFRVNSISRTHTGELAVAGFKASSREMVIRLKTDDEPMPVTPVLVGVNQVGRQFHVGTYRELSDGRAIAESLNGVDLLYRPSAGIGSSASDWTRVQSLSSQILDLTVHDDAFYGCGSAINQPPRLFLPPVTPASEPWEFEQRLPTTVTGWDGELWGLAVSDHRLVAVGVDQDQNIGKILVSGPDPYLASGYLEHSLPDIVGPGGIGTWARGVCMRGDRIVAVGERQPLGSATGLVVLSDDGGQSFRNVTPVGVTGSASRCVIEPDGTVVVAGAAGFVGVLQVSQVIFGSGFEP